MEQSHGANSMQHSAASPIYILKRSSYESQDFDILDYIPEGYRFCPYDDELIEDYLMKKLNNEELPRNRIGVVNFYSNDPWELTAKFEPQNDDGEWYFFTPREKKYPKGSRPNRGTPSGYWKPTGTDRDILSYASGHTIGCKKALDFYRGKHPGGEKSCYKMHEYRVKNGNSQSKGRAENDMRLDDWVLCKLYEKKKDKGEGSSSTEGNCE